MVIRCALVSAALLLAACSSPSSDGGSAGNAGSSSGSAGGNAGGAAGTTGSSAGSGGASAGSSTGGAAGSGGATAPTACKGGSPNCCFNGSFSGALTGDFTSDGCGSGTRNVHWSYTNQDFSMVRAIHLRLESDLAPGFVGMLPLTGVLVSDKASADVEATYWEGPATACSVQIASNEPSTSAATTYLFAGSGSCSAMLSDRDGVKEAVGVGPFVFGGFISP
jgi:hypothetical protein